MLNLARLGNKGLLTKAIYKCGILLVTLGTEEHFAVYY